MRKIISAIVAAALVASLFAGCANKPTNSSSDSTSSEITSTAVSSDVSSSSTDSSTSSVPAVSSQAASTVASTPKTSAPAATNTSLSKVAAPTSNYSTGAYTSAISVVLKTTTAGATIYYTTNGSTPTTSSTKYSNAINITTTTTLKAIAVKSGMANSITSSFSFVYTKLEGNISTDGSTALQPLLQQAISPFQSKYKSVFGGTISIGGGGSGQGITDVTNGTVQVGDSDVLTSQIGADGTGLVDHKVCVVAVGIAVSANVYNNLKDISSVDLKNIFNGTTTDWSQVKGWKGGSLPIQVYYRKLNSGTRVLFETYGSCTSLSDNTIAGFQNFTRKDSSGDLETAINTAPDTVGAIGYETLPYCAKLKLLTFDGVAPTYDNVYNGSYKIWGYEHMYTKGAASPTVQAFIDFITSSDFNSTITSNGYGLISSMKVSR